VYRGSTERDRSVNPPDSRDGQFDPGLEAWLLRSYADVALALREERLSAGGAEAQPARSAVREAGAGPPVVASLSVWRGELVSSARSLVARLPAGEPVDVLAAFAVPWAGALAVLATGAPAAGSARLSDLARTMFLAAAAATDGDPDPLAQAAAAEMARSFPGAEAPLAVQTFVALSQTLPGLLGCAWLALLEHPEQTRRLRQQPELMAQAIEELLRRDSPARAVFRRAVADLTIGRARIAAGQRVILLLASANRDPERFPDPDRLDFERNGPPHLAFGRGTHSCVGAQLIRLAAGIATEALLGGTASLALAGEPEWVGGFAIRAPASLPVVIRRETEVA
jgi:Cytochrome P450